MLTVYIEERPLIKCQIQFKPSVEAIQLNIYYTFSDKCGSVGGINRGGDRIVGGGKYVHFD